MNLRVVVCDLVFCVVLLTAATSINAATPRTWTDSTGKHEIVGELVQFKSGWIQLKKANGETTALKVDKLSLLDQAHVARVTKSNAGEGEPPVADASNRPKTGRFQTSFEGNSSITTVRQILTRLLDPAAAQQQGTKLSEMLDAYPYDIRKETFEVYVPPDYAPAVPYGVMVFINSADTGEPMKDWLPVLKKHRLIFVGPNDAGNKKDPVLRRIPLAVEAVHNLTQQYNIDRNRIYISGNSGGGRAASWAAMGYGDVFTGGQYHVGANSYRDLKLAGNKFLPGSIHIPSRELFDNARANHRYVLITGDEDFNRPQMKALYDAMTTDGFTHLTYLQIPDGKHGPPNGVWYDKGLTALDAPLKATAAEAFKQAETFAERNQRGDALLAYQRAAAYGEEQEFVTPAKEASARLQFELTEYVADIGQLIKMNEKRAAAKEIAKLRKVWGEAAASDAKRLAEQSR